MFQNTFSDPPIYITENGFAQVGPLEIEDVQRSEFYKETIDPAAVKEDGPEEHNQLLGGEFTTVLTSTPLSHTGKPGDQGWSFKRSKVKASRAAGERKEEGGSDSDSESDSGSSSSDRSGSSDDSGDSDDEVERGKTGRLLSNEKG